MTRDDTAPGRPGPVVALRDRVGGSEPHYPRNVPPMGPYHDRWVGSVDSRTQAIDWLQDNTTAADTVLVVEELAILPSEVDRLDAEVVVVAAQQIRIYES